MSIKISNLEIFCIKIPLRKPMYLSERTIEYAENIIVKIEANGIHGWGESASAPRMTGDTISGMKEIINRWIKPLILDKDIEDYVKIIKKIDNTIYSNSGSKFAVYSALLDLYCRIKKISLHELLGQKIRNDFKSMRILANKDIDDDLLEAEELQHAIFTNPEDHAQNFTKLLEASEDIPKLIFSYDNHAWTTIDEIALICKRFGRTIDIISTAHTHGKVPMESHKSEILENLIIANK